MKYLLVLSVFFTVFATSQKAEAVREVVFKNEVKVYADRDEKSAVVGIYNRNDSIPISKEKYGAWRKVIAEQDGKKRIGWFKVSDAKGAKIRTREDADSLDPKNPIKYYKRKNGAGILGSLSYVYQSGGEAAFQLLNSNFSADYDSATGVNFYFGFFGDFNLSDKTALRAYMTLRKMERSGEGTLKQEGVATGVKRDFRIEQEMITLGTTLKWYKNSRSQFWWGPGLEIGKSTDFKFISDKRESTDPNISADIKDDPIYIFLSANMGYDLHLGGSFFILPEMKLSVIPNGDPLIMNLEIWVPVAFSF